MSRFQLALNVDNLGDAMAFYSKLFNTEPAKLKDGYANFAIVDPALKLVLLENPGNGGSTNHLGVEVQSSDTVHAEIARLTSEDMFTEEEIGRRAASLPKTRCGPPDPAGRSGKSTPSWRTRKRSAQARNGLALIRRADAPAPPVTTP